MSIAYTYILECCDGSFYTGSTIDLNKRLVEHMNGNGANHTRKRLPISLAYFEAFPTIQQAYKREKQIQKWSRNKKLALITGNNKDLKKFAACENQTSYKNYKKM